MGPSGDAHVCSATVRWVEDLSGPFHIQIMHLIMLLIVAFPDKFSTTWYDIIMIWMLTKDAQSIS